MLAAGLLLMLYLGVRVLGERVGVGEVVGVLGITAGIGLLAWGTPAGAEAAGNEAAVIAVMGTMALISLVPFALRGRGRLDSATFVIVASALAYGTSKHRHEAGQRRRRFRRLEPLVAWRPQQKRPAGEAGRFWVTTGGESARRPDAEPDWLARAESVRLVPAEFGPDGGDQCGTAQLRSGRQRRLRGRPGNWPGGGLGRAQAVGRAPHVQAGARTHRWPLTPSAPSRGELKHRLHL